VDLLPSRLHTVAEQFGDRVALQVDGGASLTYAEWDGRASAVARGLGALGVGRGDRVLLLVAPSSAEIFQIGFFAVLRAGAVAVPVNPRMARRELTHVLEDSGAVAVVCGPGQAERGAALAAEAGRDVLVIAPGGGSGPDWDELAAGDPTFLEPDVGPGDLADVLYTSGTTGQPKGVAATHRSAMVAHPLMPLERGGTLLHAVPLATLIGTHGTQLLCLRLALTNLTLPSFDPARYAALVAEYRPAWTVMVPAHALLLLESGALEGVDTSSLRMVIYGSAPMPHHAVEGLAAAFPRATLMNGYGLTEGGTSVVTMPPGEALKRPGAVGRPLDLEAVRVVDEDGTDVAAGMVGEVTIRVPPGDRFYLNDPEATAATWRGEWVLTGDLGYLDDEHYLYLVDRKKDLIVRGGYNVSSIEVEGALHEHPAVVEAAVLGVAHPVLGQDVAAVVRLRPGTELSLEEVRDFLADRLSDYKRPRSLTVRTEPLPRNAMGKLDKRTLRQDLEGATPGGPG
jgi:fatty-acyl-CoA synthase/long-chain acyl-CoA synthetase